MILIQQIMRKMLTAKGCLSPQHYYSLLCLLFLILLPGAASGKTMAVFIGNSPTLTANEADSLVNIISQGFADTKEYQIVDAETMNQMLEDKVTEALLLGHEDQLDAIQQKYQVDALVNVSSTVECMKAIGGYSMASASVTMAARLPQSGTLFAQKTSEPQNGYYGMPEWIGTTDEAARKVALTAATADVFDQLDLSTIPMPLAAPMKLKLEKRSFIDSEESGGWLEMHSLNKAEAARMITLAKNTLGSRAQITSTILDSAKRIAAVGVRKTEIDLQRGRRLDTALFQVLDYRKGRMIRSFALPRDIPGIRRPRSREIVDFAFAPSGRFMALVSEHAVLWVYDILSGTLLAHQVLSSNPVQVSFSTNSDFLKVHDSKNVHYFQIVHQ